jgi:adenylate cyclase
MSHGALARWIADQGLRNLPLEELVDGFARRLNEAGLPVARVFVGMNTLHPLLRARSLIWDRATGPSTHFEFQHNEVDVPIMRQSPFVTMLRDGLEEMRSDLTEAREGEWPVFGELRGLGMTEWLGCVFPFGELSPQVPALDSSESAQGLWLVASFTTDEPGGYSATDLAILRELLPFFALAVKASTMRAVFHGLLASYLGGDPTARMLSGAVRRGEVQEVEAVLFYADLRDFTQLADTLPGREMIALLDECFDCMVRPVNRKGGEVLKFLGDGLLAIFRIDNRRRSEICVAALTAASEALDLMDILVTQRRNEGKPTPALDIALHVGAVQYGNVGTDTRLDFTVIGPAVNEAARIELLCKELGHPLLVSRAFAEAASASRGHLVSLGGHRLRGVREETELFTLSGGPPS